MKSKRLFYKRDKIRTKDGKEYCCIIADVEIAVFAPLRKIRGGVNVKYKDMFVVTNDSDNISGFEYAMI